MTGKIYGSHGLFLILTLNIKINIPPKKHINTHKQAPENIIQIDITLYISHMDTHLSVNIKL